MNNKDNNSNNNTNNINTNNINTNNMYSNRLGLSAPANPSLLKPKKSIKYSLSKKLGSGAYSKVYFAVDKYGNQFAVKRIDKTKLSPSKLDTFSKELTISKDLDHINIVKCYETIKTDNYWNVVLEYCNLMTLYDHNSALKSMRISEEKELFVKFYLVQLKNALKYLQEKNIIHRDLKPMNILFTQEEQLPDGFNKITLDYLMENKNKIILKLADFTFARFFDESTIEEGGYTDMITTVCGSPLYMAPELLIDRTYNIKADLWSFGVIMFEMLYGKNPYQSFGPSSPEKLATIMKTQVIEYKEGYSDICINLLKSLLVLEPANRISWDEFFKHEWFGKEEENKQTHNLYQTNGFEIGVYNNEILEEYPYQEDKPDKLEEFQNNPEEEMFKMDEEMDIKKPIIKKDDKKFLIVDDWFSADKESEILNITRNVSQPRTIIRNDFISPTNTPSDDSKQYMSVAGSVSGSVIDILAKSMNKIFGWPKSM